MDTQAIEIIGRNILVNQLIRAGLEVAFPIRDRGIDLIIYSDRPEAEHDFSAIAIQLKVSSGKSFSINKIFEKTAQLIIVYVWDIESENPRAFALTYCQVLKIASDCGYIKTQSWAEHGRYAVNNPGTRLQEMLSPYEMTSKRWRALFHKEKSNEKHEKLLALGRKRRNAPLPEGCHSIGEYENGAYESEYVSPYTKSAHNADAEVSIMLQDWASHESLIGKFDRDAATLGYSSSSRTNINLIALLCVHFNLSLSKTFATNLFPFVKTGAMNAGIPVRLLNKATEDFAMPQVMIVGPKLLICLGKEVFNAVRRFHKHDAVRTVGDGIDNPFQVGETWYWCQSHTGSQGTNQRTARQVAKDWKRMAENYKDSFRSMPK